MAARTAARPSSGPSNAAHAARTGRRRVDLWAPVRLGVVLALVAWAVRAGVAVGLPVGWPYLFGGLLALVAALVIRTHVTNRQERHAAGAALAFASGWVAAVWSTAPLGAWARWDYLMAALGVGVVVAVGAQAVNRREWDRGKVAEERAAWPDLMANTPWADTHPDGHTEKLAPGVYRRRFRRNDKAATTVKGLLTEEARTRYEERHGLEHGSVRVERDGKSTSVVVVTEVRKDPHAGHGGITWDGRVLRHVWEELILGYFEDGQPEVTTMWRKGVGPVHRLIAGVTGSGKSTLMRLLACATAPAEEAATVMIDCKGGQSFGAIAALFSWFLKDTDDALDTLQALVNLMRHRQEQASQWGWTGSWRPSAEHPVYFVFIDELARLVGVQAPSNAYRNRALSLLVQMVQEGRSTGFCLIAATQFPTIEAVGSSQFRSQIDWRACFRMSEPGQDEYVLTKKAKGMDASNIDEERNGTCYVQRGNACRPLPLRVLNVPDGLNAEGDPDPEVPDLVTPLLTQWWNRRTPIPEEDTDVLDADGAWSARTIYGPDGSTWVIDPDDTPAPDPEPTDAPAGRHLASVPTPKDTDTMTSPSAATVPLATLAAEHKPTPEQQAADDAARARLEPVRPDDDTADVQSAAWRLLLAAGPDGLRPVDVYRHPSVNRSPSWGYKRFAAWRDAGHLVQITEGLHRVADRYL